MSNGAQCCALEVCCPPALRRQRLIDSLAAFTGADPDYCGKFLDWMEHEDLVFAPKEFQATIDHIAALARKHPREE